MKRILTLLLFLISFNTFAIINEAPKFTSIKEFSKDYNQSTIILSKHNTAYTYQIQNHQCTNFVYLDSAYEIELLGYIFESEIDDVFNYHDYDGGMFLNIITLAISEKTKTICGKGK